MNTRGPGDPTWAELNAFDAIDRRKAKEQLVSLTIVVRRDGSIDSDIQTHDNSYAEVLTGLALAKVEMERVFADREQCPYHPHDKAAANRKIVRGAST